MGALEKVVAACLKEEQTDAAGAVNAEIKQLMQIRDDLEELTKPD